MIENNIFSKNKDKNGKSKDDVEGSKSINTPNNFIPPSIRQPQTMPDMDTLVSPFVEKIRADMMAKNFYSMRFNEFNPYANLNTNGFHNNHQSNYFEDDDEDEVIQQGGEEIQQQEGEEIQQEEEEGQIQIQPQEILFDKNGKYLKRTRTQRGRPIAQFEKANRIRDRLLEASERPSDFNIVKYGLQDFFQ